MHRHGAVHQLCRMITFKKSSELREVAARLPADRLLIETDSPYLTPEPFRGKRPNEPSFLVHTAQVLAEAPKHELASIYGSLAG